MASAAQRPLRQTPVPAAQTPSKQAIKGGIVAWLVIWIAGALVSWCYASSDTDCEQAKLISATTMIVAALPLFRHLRNGEPAFPLYALNTLYYAVGFAMGSFFTPSQEKYRVDFEPSNLLFGTCICLLAVCSQIAGYRLARGNIGSSHSHASTIARLSLTQLRTCGWCLLVLGHASLFFPSIANVPSFGQFTKLSGLAGASVLFYCALSSGMSQQYRMVLFGVIFPLVVWTGLLTGSIAEGLRYIMLGILVAAAVRRYRVAGYCALAGIALYFIFNPLKMQYRAATWNSVSELSWSQKSLLMWSLIDARYLSVDGSNFSNSTPSSEGRNAAIDRIDQLYLLLRVIRETPERVPYWYGKTFVSLPVMLVPRVLWPDKPVRGLGQQFGQAYGILGPMDFTTSVNTPWLVELYANFGVVGVVAGMCIFGMCFRYIEVNLLNNLGANHSAILMIGVFGPLIYPESDISLMWGGVFLGYASLQVAARVAIAAFPAKRRVD
jgi:hypothetical protein